MRRIIIKAGTVIAAGAASVLVLSGMAVASTQVPRWITGPELVSGIAHGNAATARYPHIPLYLRGLVATSDRHFVLRGNTAVHTLRTPAGKLTVRLVGRQQVTQRVNLRTCHLSATTRQRFDFVPTMSTRSFAGAHGPGAYQVHFAAFFGRYHSGSRRGQCDFRGRPMSRGAVVSFQAAGVLTVR